MTLLLPIVTNGQTWTWKTEIADDSGKFTSLRIDDEGNLHIAYAADSESALKYAFRPAGSSRWFTMVLDKQLGEFATSLALDPQGNPQICYTPRELKYARFDGHRWVIQQIAPNAGTVEFNCSIVIAEDGTPHVLWYQTREATGNAYLHIKHAVLKDGVWLARTIDFDREAGKWNSIVIDPQGYPHISYSVFPPGELKYASWDGKSWHISRVDSPSHSANDLATGMGISMVMNSQKEYQISYYEAPVQLGSTGKGAMKFARQRGTTWSVEKIDTILQSGGWAGFRSSLLLDHDGNPHICYESGGVLKHAYWNGKQWRIQLVAPRGTEEYLHSSMQIGRDDTLYISYRDPTDGSLRVAIGRRVLEPSTAATAKEDKKN